MAKLASPISVNQCISHDGAVYLKQVGAPDQLKRVFRLAMDGTYEAASLAHFEGAGCRVNRTDWRFFRADHDDFCHQ